MLIICENIEMVERIYTALKQDKALVTELSAERTCNYKGQEIPKITGMPHKAGRIRKRDRTYVNDWNVEDELQSLDRGIFEWDTAENELSTFNWAATEMIINCLQSFRNNFVQSEEKSYWEIGIQVFSLRFAFRMQYNI